MRVLHVGQGYTPYRHGGLISYAEDLMEGQAARGHDVAYFCSGRHYPLLGTRIKRLRRRGMRIYEVLNSPVVVSQEDRGTRWPEREVSEESIERLFRGVLDEVRPQLVHFRDMGGLPFSLLDIPHERGLPVIMSLHDYLPLCPTIKLFDLYGNVCMRTEPAPVCVLCSRDAPHELEGIAHTLGHHRRRVEARLPVLGRLPGPRTLARRWRDRRPEADGQGDVEADRVPAFQRRRDVNVERLSRADRLIAVSPRVAEIYAALGVDPSRLLAIPMARTRHESLRPHRIHAVDGPVRFVTLSGCASRAKGSGLVADALDELAATGFTADDLTLSIAGQVDPYEAERLTASPFVQLLGSYAWAELDHILEGFHVGIVPSIWEETHGWVGIEYLAKGLPLIGNARGGIVEYTRDGETGWLNRESGASGLAELMAGVVRDPGQVVALNERIVARRAELVKPMATHLDEIEAVYAELIAQSSSTAVSAG